MMSTLDTIRTGIAELPNGTPLVVALMGGTTGIGSYVAKALATTFAAQGSKLRVYVVGRKPDRAETLVRYGNKTSPGSDWRFVQGSDMSLLSEVDRVCKEIIRQEEESPFAGGLARLDVLYMSQALSPLQKSSTTEEGIDTQMSLVYYARMRIIQQLTPLLTAAHNTSHVISIFAGGFEDSVKPGEVPIGTPPPESYGVTTVRKYASFMKTFFFEELAEKHAGKISFIHIYPGLVDGPVFYSDVNPWWFRVMWRLMKPLASWYITSPEVCGMVMVYLATQRYPAKGTVKQGNEIKVVGGVAYSSQRELGGGAYGVGQRGEENKDVKYVKVRKQDTAEEVWEHTMKVFAQAEQMSGTQGARPS